MIGGRIDSRVKRTLAISAAAAAVLLAIRFLPARPRLTHMDFVAGGPDALEFCEADHPRFLPVVDRSSPVTASLAASAAPAAGKAADVLLTLRTNTGKIVEAADLLPTGGRKVGLEAIDPTLGDFQAPRAVPTRNGGWRFSFTPRFGGTYRIFADLTPEATGREMYASADLVVAGPAGPSAPDYTLASEREGVSFTLAASAQPVRIREPVILRWSAKRRDGSAASLQPFDGVSPELVAFDRERSGMVDLRPVGAGPLSCQVAFPDSGRYVIWGRAGVDGLGVAVPFALDVEP